MDIPLAISNLGANQHLQICQSPLTFDSINIIVIVCSVVGLLWAIYNFLMVRRIDLEQETQDDGEEANADLTTQQKRFLQELSFKISDASMQYLKQQYAFCLLTLALLFPLVWFVTEKGLTTAVSLLAGGLVNIILTLLSLIIAIQSNYRIAYSAKFGTGEVFRILHKASCAIGFGVCSISVLALIILIDLILQVQELDSHSSNPNYFRGLFEAVAGYALGTSVVSIFTKVSGGVFASSSEFGAELVGKMGGGMPYKSSRNPATITEIGGQNIGQLLGGVTQFTSSFAQAVCVVFILTCTALSGYGNNVTCGYFISNFMFPLMAIALGLFFAVAVSSIVTNFIYIELVNEGQNIMRLQLWLMTLMMFGSLYLAAFLTFPPQFTLTNIYERYYDVQQPWIPYLCAVIGIGSAVILCLFNYLFTSSSFFPIQSLVQSSRSSSAANLANGLAIGYISTIVPIIIIGVAIYFSNMLLGFYGVGLGVVGVVSGMPIFLIHHVFAPLADNAYNIAQLLDLGGDVREKTEQMDSIGKSSIARTRAFTIQPAALLGIALFGGYLFNVNLHDINSQDDISITKPLVFSGILLGAMVPFVFSGIILPSVESIGLELLDNVAQQLRADQGILQGNTEADYAGASGVVAWSSLLSSIFPISIALLFPLVLGFSFGVHVITGYLIGLVVSGIQFALSGMNAGQAWKSTRKMIGSGLVTDEQGKVLGIQSECYKTSLIGQQVGSSLQKAASIPLSVIIKLSGIVCMVFGSKILQIRG